MVSRQGSSHDEQIAAQRPEFRAAPPWLRFARRMRRVWRWRLLRAWYALPLTGGDKVVGSYTRERQGERSTVSVTRRQDAFSKYVIVPPGEWEQDEADSAIKRGQELARKHGW